MIRRPASRVRLRVLLLLPVALAAPASVARAQDTDACIAANEAAVARKKADKLIEARKQLSVCASPSCPDVVRTSCERRLGEVGQAIPSLVVFATDAAGNDLTAVKVLIDGVAYADRLDGNAIELDPGEHELRFEVAGHPPTVKRVFMLEGERGRRESVVVGLPPAPPLPPGIVPGAGAEPIRPDGGSRRTLGWIVGGVGAAALATGGVFGVFAIRAHDSYEQQCGASIGAPAGSCNSQGVTGHDDAATKATISTVFFVVGGVAAAAGVTLVLTAPRSVTTARVGVGPGGVVVQGGF